MGTEGKKEGYFGELFREFGWTGKGWDRLHRDSSNLAYNWYKYTTWKQSGGNSYRGNKAFTV